MKPCAALLIDLENFYHSRCDHFADRNLPTDRQPAFADDLAVLVKYAEKMAELPLAVRRAYANFNMLPPGVGPRDLMHHGVEPVQVFCLSETTNKNAADMKLAMDAVALVSSGPFEHVVLVTGDADFVPVILELKRRGVGVSAIAVTGSTSPLIKKFVDKFRRFEELETKLAARPQNRVAKVLVPAGPVAAPAPPAAVIEPAQPAAPADFARVADALHRVLGRTRPLRVDKVHRALSMELGTTFEPTAFGCATTSRFLHKNAAALGIALGRGAQNEQVIDFATAPVPASNGVHHPAPAEPVADLHPDPGLHSAAGYKQLLATRPAGSNETIVTVVPWAALVSVCDAAVAALAPPTGGPTPSLGLLAKLKAAGAPDDARFLISALRSALPPGAAPGEYALPAETTGVAVRARLLQYIVYALRTRLKDNGVAGPVVADELIELFEPGAAREQVRDEILAALAEPEPQPEPAPAVAAAPARTSAKVEAAHTPAAYRELLKSGGAPDSAEPEDQNISPPPWSSLARVCDDTFAALGPSAGVADLGLAEYLDKLYAAEKVTAFTNYRSHVRRAVGILKVSNAVLETDGRVSLHPDVTDPSDIRWAVLGIMLTVLANRLRAHHIPGPVRADAFVHAIGGGPHTDELVPQIAQAIESMERAAEAGDPAPAVPEPAPVTEPAHADPVTRYEVVIELAAEASPAPADTAPTEPTDPFAFDGALPDLAPASEPEPVPRLPEPSASGVIDVAALTRAAVTGAEEAVSVPPVEAVVPVKVAADWTPEPAGPVEQPAFPPKYLSPAEAAALPPATVAEVAHWLLPAHDPVEPPTEAHTAPAVAPEATAPPAAVEEPAPCAFEDEYPLAIPVADLWEPDETAPEPTVETPPAVPTHDAAGAVRKLDENQTENSPALPPPLPPGSA